MTRNFGSDVSLLYFLSEVLSHLKNDFSDWKNCPYNSFRIAVVGSFGGRLKNSDRELGFYHLLLRVFC